MHLNRQQVNTVKEKITSAGVHHAELAEDLLDHLCVAIENEMADGTSFANAFENVFNRLEEDELKLTDMKTQELLEGKKIYDPNIPQSIGLIGLYLLGSLLIILFMLMLPVAMQHKEAIIYHPAFTLLTNLLVFSGVMAFAMYKIRRSQGRPFTFSFQPVPVYVYPVVIGVALLSQFWLDPLNKIPLIATNSVQHIYKQIGQYGILLVSLTGIFNIILFELLIRGIILNGLLKTHIPVWAIVWSSLFAVAFNFFSFPLTTLAINLMSGWLYWKTKSLYPSIIMFSTALISGICAAKFLGDVDNEILFTWQNQFSHIWMYATAVAASFALSVGLFYYLHKRLLHTN